MDRLLRLSDVTSRTGMSKSTIYRKIGQGLFPAPVSVGGQSVRWRESDINTWMQSLTPRAA
jgi:prophage regulatory protein